MEEEKEQKILLNIEELEERIAPHGAPLGGGHAAVEFNSDGTGHLELPNGEEQDTGAAAEDGLRRARDGGN